MSDKFTDHVILHNCPHCGAKHDRAASEKDHKPPSEGDVGLCFVCAKPFVFGTNKIPRLPTEEETRSDAWNHALTIAGHLLAMRATGELPEASNKNV